VPELPRLSPPRPGGDTISVTAGWGPATAGEGRARPSLHTLASALPHGTDSDAPLARVSPSGPYFRSAQPPFTPPPSLSAPGSVVSRIEVTDYSHGSTDLLAIQIDAA
jgi:hypothetical protein